MTIDERKPPHPGTILLEEFMKPKGVTQTKLAKLTGIWLSTINLIIHGKRSITPHTAIKLGAVFDMSPKYWLNLQMKLDVWDELHRMELVREQ